MGTRLGAAVLAMLIASMGPAGAVVHETGQHRAGALGAIAPGIEVAGWIEQPNGRSAARLVVGAIEEIEAEGEFTWADQPFPMGIGQGVDVVGADAWHRAGRLGAGVKIAVVDLGFEGYRNLLGDELPDRVIARSFRSDGDVGAGMTHGTAAAEIVHEVAPEAELYLLNYDYSLNPVIEYLIDEEIDIVSFSVGYLSGPFDGTSPVASTVQQALDAGIVWVTAAGNYAQRHWGAAPEDGDGDRWLEIEEFDEINEFRVAAGAEFHLYLSWLGNADLDICLYEMPASIGDQVACASGTQGEGSRPLEVVKWRNDTGSTQRYGFSVREQRGGADRIDVFGWNVTSLEHGSTDHSIVVPGDVDGAVTVGAVAWSSPQQAASFSSRGPTADGRMKPDLVAPSGVATQAAGAFVGTSAAAPHVAGLAALLLAAYPSTGPSELGDLLADRAKPLGSDRVYGSGLARAGARDPACGGFAPTIVGSGGDDWIEGTDDRDVIIGLGGDDEIRSGGGDDVVCGGMGADLLRGAAGNDRLMGNGGDDLLFGGAGKDRLLGGPGDDDLAGGPGKDRLKGGAGHDEIRGGSGVDRCAGGSMDSCERIPQ